MEQDFWHSRWQNGQIGFHEGTPNTLLTTHFKALGVAAGGRIFVPLCGKSQDMLWLRAEGFTVVGAELSRLAVTQFFTDAGLTPKISTAGKLERFDAENITLFAGDIFDLTNEMLGIVDAIYDRAALVALPAPLRARYAAHLTSLTGTAPQLLITFEYDQSRHPGPPFSISDADLNNCYGTIYELNHTDIKNVPGGMKGICTATENLWLLKPATPS